MATYYIQISSAWQGDRWRTAHSTENKNLAEFLSTNLEIEENQFGQNNPGLTGKRYSRVISKTRLLRDSGSAAVRMAEEDLGDWEDPPTHIRGHGKDRKPISGFMWHQVYEEVKELITTYEENQAEKEIEGKVDFLLRDIPSPLHTAIKKAATKEETTMAAWILTACQEKLS